MRVFLTFDAIASLVLTVAGIGGLLIWGRLLNRRDERNGRLRRDDRESGLPLQLPATPEAPTRPDL